MSAVSLDATSAARVHAYWEAWCTQPPEAGNVHVVSIDDVLLVRSPTALRARIERAAPTTADALVDAIGEPTVRHGAARLTYADRITFRGRPSDRAIPVDGADPRVAALRDAADRDEWWESIGDHAWSHGTGLVVGHAVVALATYEIWDDTIAHVAVFTASGERSRGWSTEVASAAIDTAFAAGLVPQWRAHVGNTASLRVSEKLGFVACGFQLYARLRDAGS
ncbi:MAG: GNAT family N-acetyltransferase [Acidimicrobiia bacterium]